MYSKLTSLFIIVTYFFYQIESILIFNLNSTNKIFCHSCKGQNCERIISDQEDIIMCNKHTQLCWAGFVDQQPVRTCASRYCTPSGISLESDIRIETCCHSSLCNNIPLSWSFWNQWYQRTTTRHPTTATSTRKPTTVANKKTSRIYVVNELVDGDEKSDEDETNSLLFRSKINASDPASFGINWERVPYKDFSDRVASISKLLILVMPVLLVLIF